MAPHTHPKKRKQYKKPTKKHTEIHWQPHFTQPQHDVWYGRRHTNSAKRSKTHTQNGDTTQSRNIGQHGQHLPHVKSVPGWWSGHVTQTERTQLTWWIKKRDNKGGRRGAEWRGMSRSYLSIQKICWRWGSDRCPFHMLPHAAWVWKEQEGRKGHWAAARNKLTHRYTHTYSATHTSPTVVKSHESSVLNVSVTIYLANPSNRAY